MFSVAINHLGALRSRTRFACCCFPSAHVDLFLLLLERSRGLSAALVLRLMPYLLGAGRVLSASCFFVWVIEPLLCTSSGVIPHQGMGRLDVFFKG